MQINKRNQNGSWLIDMLMFVLGISILACGKMELRVDGQFATYVPKRRVGVKNISIEQRRIINYFGFRDRESYSARLELAEIKRRGGQAGLVNDIYLTVEKGVITGYRKTGTRKPLVDDYIEGIISTWKGSNGARFTDFIDKIEFIIKLDQGGTIEIIFSDFQITEPEDDQEKYKYFFYISDRVDKMYYLIPFDGFRITNVRTRDSEEKFTRLNKNLKDWMAANPAQIPNFDFTLN